MNNTLYFLALNRISGVGPRTVARCLKLWPNLADLFRLSTSELKTVGFSDKTAQAISQFDFHQVDADLQWQAKNGHELLTLEHPNYPALLKEIHDPPFVLYAKGNLSCLQQPTIAVVGTRNPSVIGSETARRFSFELARQGITIVSGLALGIDAQAHTGCLEASGKTIAVLATGIDCIYPRRHGLLASQISENGLLLSEFPLKTSPIAGHFPRRNRIISGLSLSTLVVEAAMRSGSLITARFALEQNRDVLAIPGSIHNPQARGCHQLLQQGAKLITSSQDVLSEINLEYFFVKKVLPNESVACENDNLIRCIGFEATSIDHMMSCSGLSINEVMCQLVELELQGMINAVPGGYMRCEL
ncbi:MAG: DNA-processing protein DprA [Legionellaceae bacterium]|nr:DNA-processing protein DprA [Legionellaceae bacterium]